MRENDDDQNIVRIAEIVARMNACSEDNVRFFLTQSTQGMLSKTAFKALKVPCIACEKRDNTAKDHNFSLFA